MSLTTPDKIRSLRRKLYCKEKAEPAFRFYVLYDKICREDILHHAYRLARANAGAPGVDEVTFAQIEKRGLEAWLAGLREELVSKTYRPDPVRRGVIPQTQGGGGRAAGDSNPPGPGVQNPPQPLPRPTLPGGRLGQPVRTPAPSRGLRGG